MPTITTFPTPFGWFALVGEECAALALTFGHKSSGAAIKALSPALLADACFGPWNAALVERIQAYTEGEPVDFNDVKIDLGRQTDFQRLVVHYCRQIPYGKTSTYTLLAAKTGHAGAARAVGNCMACNRMPILVPCHRVLASGGKLGGYSAPGGISVKLRLLELEQARI